MPHMIKDTLSNGNAECQSNGKSSNGEASSVDTHIGPQGLIHKVEFVRLIQQALHDLGFQSISKELEEASGIQRQSDLINEFSAEIMRGNWAKALELLQLIKESHLEAQPCWPSSSSQTACFLILEQKFLEALEREDLDGALHTLRQELGPLGENDHERRRQLHWLATLFMCTSTSDLYEKSSWCGSGEGARLLLLSQLQILLPPTLMLPDHRLQHLVEQALLAQKALCALHNTSNRHMSLLQDHQCHDQIPLLTSQIMEAHTDEVWHLGWSHSGQLLASGSKDHTVRVWELQPCSVLSAEGEVGSQGNGCVGDGTSSHRLCLKHTLLGHSDAVAFVAWSPDDSMLLSCSNDHLVQLWSVADGRTLQIYARHTDSVTTCAWLSCGQRFVTGGFDRNIYMWDIHGNELRQWKGGRINDLVVTPDGKYLVSTHGGLSEKSIVIHDLESGTEETIMETHAITSLHISRDGRHLLVNLQCQEIHLWDISDPKNRSPPSTIRAKKIMVFQFQGLQEKHGRFVIRSCFGGSDESFIVSGSEDSQVYIWHGRTGDLLHVLPGHSGTVNAVSWNPTNPHVFASASDDHTIRIWGLGPSIAGTPIVPPGILNRFALYAAKIPQYSLLNSESLHAK